jgi:hypothetical protein
VDGGDFEGSWKPMAIWLVRCLAAFGTRVTPFLKGARVRAPIFFKICTRTLEMTNLIEQVCRTGTPAMKPPWPKAAHAAPNVSSDRAYHQAMLGRELWKQEHSLLRVDRAVAPLLIKRGRPHHPRLPCGCDQHRSDLGRCKRAVAMLEELRDNSAYMRRAHARSAHLYAESAAWAAPCP